MKKSNELVLKAFLSRCSPEKKKALERFLSEKERARLEELPSFPKEASAKGFSKGNLLEQVHWSWFLPTLKTYPQREQKGFLTALASSALSSAESLGAALELQVPSPDELTEAGRSFLREILVNSLVGTEDRLLPVDYLPPSPLNRLLGLSKKDLIRLIDFLSMYDLSAELRQIVETKTLKKIYAILTEDERKVLKIAASQKEVFSLPRIGLEKWDGSEESLRVLLHRRGLSRFGTALSGQNLDFIWYICHHLDIGRGNALFKLCSKEGSPEISESLIRQIEELLSNTDRLL